MFSMRFGKVFWRRLHTPFPKSIKNLMFFSVFDGPGAAAKAPKRHPKRPPLNITEDQKYHIFLCLYGARNRENSKKRSVFCSFVGVPNSRHIIFLNLKRIVKYEILLLISRARGGPKL